MRLWNWRTSGGGRSTTTFLSCRTAATAGIALVFVLALSSNARADGTGRYDRDRVRGLPYRYGEQPLHESYAGHISVRNWKAAADDSANSGEAKLFYWYFPAIAPKVEEPPLLLWIQGGPGSSSMIGLFTELGPLELTDDGEFFRRNVSWANSYDLLVVDQPAGTGFSSVRPKKSPALDDLFPLARKLPRHIADEWRASYPGDVNQYSSIKSPMTAEYAVAEARATLEHLKSQTGKWPDRKMRFVNKLESILNARESQVFGMDPFAPNSNRQKMYVDSGRPRELDLPVRRIVDDPYL
ncbi:hypothetical protein H4S06_006063, partial [Coemansia sp. BCRC 34490]